MQEALVQLLHRDIFFTYQRRRRNLLVNDEILKHFHTHKKERQSRLASVKSYSMRDHICISMKFQIRVFFD
jgi:hypothetical protein